MIVPLFFLTPSSTILTPGRGSPLLSVTVPLISIPAATAAVFTIQNIIKKSQTLFDSLSIRTFERGKEKRFFFIFMPPPTNKSYGIELKQHGKKAFLSLFQNVPVWNVLAMDH